MAELAPWMTTFLTEQPAHTGVLATVRTDGSAHAKPIWFALDGDSLVFNTGDTSVAGRNLVRDPRATLCIEVETPPYTFLIVSGPVEVTTYDEDPEGVRSWAGRLGARYLGADQEEALAARNGVPGELLVRLRIDRVAGAASVSD